MHIPKETFKKRRLQLLKETKERHAQRKSGAIVIIAGFETSERIEFRQESSFYYFTGITEPGTVLVIDYSGKETLYIPAFDGKRSQWVSSVIEPTKEAAQKYGIDEITYLGDAVRGYTMPLLFSQDSYKHLIKVLSDYASKQGGIFTFNSENPRAYTQQKIVLERLAKFISGFESSVHDISALAAKLRRNKSRDEIELIYNAIEVTIVAQQGAACSMEEGKKEYEVRAGIDYVFREANRAPAFPSIVAAGANSVILHSTPGERELKKGELVVVDIGAEYEYYCADLTRTYPVAGTFTKRQRDVYNIVLDTQQYIAGIAAPGLWLNNKKYADKSLHHLAVAYLEKKGYGKYFTHGIGHFLGIDVHDVGDLEEPLTEGDVITIEPGIYIPEEGFGIRIEDDYWIIKDGVMCLSEDLARDPDSIEEMSQATLDFDEDDEDEH